MFCQHICFNAQNQNMLLISTILFLICHSVGFFLQFYLNFLPKSFMNRHMRADFWESGNGSTVNSSLRKSKFGILYAIELSNSLIYEKVPYFTLFTWRKVRRKFWYFTSYISCGQSFHFWSKWRNIIYFCRIKLGKSKVCIIRVLQNFNISSFWQRSAILIRHSTLSEHVPSFNVYKGYLGYPVGFFRYFWATGPPLWIKIFFSEKICVWVSFERSLHADSKKV